MQDTTNPRLLLVDDVPANLDLLLQMLEPRGYFVMVANNGEKALKIAAQTKPDLILLDIMMPPGIDGYEVCTRLKADPATRDIPVIFLSALDDTEVKVKAFATGGVDYIAKPFHLEEVLARVTNHLRLRSIQQALEEANRQLELLAVRDGLTGIANRRRLDDYLPEAWRDMAREQRPLGLILCDIDCFKLYNDHYGHQAGDQCLRSVALAIAGALKRPRDLAGRYGGEEFLVVLPATDMEGAAHIAEEIAAAVACLDLRHESSSAAPVVTLSMGATSGIPDPAGDPAALLAAADRALYRAKAAGRNRCVVSDLLPLAPLPGIDG